jgi:serine/threonine protein kinase
MIGSTISHYRIIEKLGGGRIGTVYKVQEMKLTCFVVLKFLLPGLPDKDDIKYRCLDEVYATSSLWQINISSIFVFLKLVKNNF